LATTRRRDPGRENYGFCDDHRGHHVPRRTVYPAGSGPSVPRSSDAPAFCLWDDPAAPALVPRSCPHAVGANPRTASESSTPKGTTRSAGMVTPLATYRSMCARHSVNEPVNDQLVDHLVGDRGQGPLAVTRTPGVHMPRGAAPAEPAVELGVGLDVQVRRDHSPATARAVAVSSEGMTKMRATISLPGPTSFIAVVTSSADNQFKMAPSASRPASLSMPARRAPR